MSDPGLADGDLADGLRRECERAGLPYRPEPDPQSPRAARVDDGRRCTRVRHGFDDGSLLVSVSTGRQFLQAEVASLSTVVAMLDRWQSGARLTSLAAEFPAFGSVALADACERGDRIDYDWRRYYENPCRQLAYELMRPLIDAAFAAPPLRARQPLFSAHFSLLRLKTPGGAPYGYDGPSARRLPGTEHVVRRADGREVAVGSTYVVRSPDDRELGTGPAARAVELLVAALR